MKRTNWRYSMPVILPAWPRHHAGVYQRGRRAKIYSTDWASRERHRHALIPRRRSLTNIEPKLRQISDEPELEQRWHDWQETQTNLGTALWRLGERESGTARLEEAVAAYRDALKETTRERVPLDWAMSFGDEGVALMLLAERRRDAAMAKTALDQINTAFETMRDGGHAPSAAYYEQQLPRARALVARLRGQRR
jgi:hypothetical protein